MKRHQAVATCGLIGLVLLPCLLSFNDPSAANRTARRKETLDWGLYQILWSRAYGDQLSKELAKFTSKPAYVTFYRDLGRPFSEFAIDSIAHQGATAIVSLELWSWHGGRQGSYLPAIIAGKYDDFFRKWARDAEADGRRVLLRFGFEFNGDWFTWSRDPKAYVASWRHVHDIFREIGATNVEWVWAPNIVSCPPAPENGMHRYYPGDAYVDWIGVDGYNFGDHSDRWHKWQSFEEIFGAVLADFQVRYQGTPVIITEFACAPGKAGQRERWIRAAYENLQRRPQVKAVIWFNYDKRREGEPNWRIDRTPESLRAFNETFAAPRKTNN